MITTKNKKVMMNCLNGTTPDFVGILSAEDYKMLRDHSDQFIWREKYTTEDPAISSFIKLSEYSHTISVRLSNEHNAMLIFDTEKQNLIKLGSVEDFSKHLQCYIEVSVFKSTIWIVCFTWTRVT